METLGRWLCAYRTLQWVFGYRNLGQELGLSGRRKLNCSVLKKWKESKDRSDLARSTEALWFQCRGTGAMPFGSLRIPPTLHSMKATVLSTLSSPHTYSPGLPPQPWEAYFSPNVPLALGVSRLLISCPRYPLIPIPLHTHRLPWKDFCEFLGAWNTDSRLEEKMKKKVEKAYRHQGTQASNIPLLPAPIKELCLPAHSLTSLTRHHASDA